jgi:tight adherence protein B
MSGEGWVPFAAALGTALAAVLCLPALRASLRSWARGLHRSREHTRERELSESFIFVDPLTFARTVAALVLAAALCTWVATGSGLLAAAAGGAALLIPEWWARVLRRRRRRRLLAQLPDAIDLLAASLRSGLGLVAGIEQLAVHQPAPLGEEVALVVRRQRLGDPLEPALEAWRERIGGPEVAQFVAAVSVARELGGGLSEVLARVAATMRERQVIERKIEALTAQGKLQARIVGAMPLLLLLVMTRLQPGPMHLMFTTPPGWAALSLMAVLELGGAWLLARQVRIDV